MSVGQEIALLVGVLLAANLGAALAVYASARGWAGFVSSYSQALSEWRSILGVAAALVGLALVLLIWVFWWPSSLGWNVARLACALPPMLLGAFVLVRDARNRAQMRKMWQDLYDKNPAQAKALASLLSGEGFGRREEKEPPPDWFVRSATRLALARWALCGVAAVLPPTLALVRLFV